MSVGLESPGGAIALAAVGVLIVLTLLERRRRVVPVATLFLWRKLPPHHLERRRFRPDALFLLQLALLLALIGGLLRPYVERGGAAPPRALVIVLDVSASMQAREASGTRFALARQRAQRLVADAAPGSEVMLVAAAERPHVALRWSADAARVRQRLETLEPLDVTTNLAPAVALALGEGEPRPGARVAVFSDLPPEASGIAPADLTAVDWIAIGHTDDNVAIASLTVTAPPFGGGDDDGPTASVVVRNYASTTHAVTLEATVGGAMWSRRGLLIAPRASEHVLLTRPPARGVMAARVLEDDALPADDTALAWIPPARPLDILLVTDSRELAAAFGDVAAAIPGSRVEVVTRARYAEHPPDGRRIALFDGIVPDVLPAAVNPLYVAPPPGNDVCPTAGVAETASVIDWDAGHPLLGDLGPLRAVTMERPRRLVPAEWGVPLVLAAERGTAFPILVVGERKGRRTACLGAELSGPLASSDRLPLLLMTLGTLRWLDEPYETPTLTVTTGTPVLARSGATAPVDHPGLRIGGDPPVLLAEHAGEYAVGPAGAAHVVLANLMDDRESDIGRAGGGEWLATLAPPAAAGVTERRPLERWLYLVAAALLGLEWLAWRQRSGRGVGA